MNYLHSLGDTTVKNKVVFKAGHTPRTDIAEPGVPKSSRPANAGIGGKCLERLVSPFDDARGGIGIILGDEMPNAPKLILDAGIKEVFRHQSGLVLSVYGVGETLPRRPRLRLGRGGQCFAAIALPAHQGSWVFGATARLGRL